MTEPDAHPTHIKLWWPPQDDYQGHNFWMRIEGRSGGTWLHEGHVCNQVWLRPCCSCGWEVSTDRRYTMEDNAFNYWFTAHAKTAEPVPEPDEDGDHHAVGMALAHVLGHTMNALGQEPGPNTARLAGEVLDDLHRQGYLVVRIDDLAAADEDPEQIRAIFEAGEKGVTGRDTVGLFHNGQHSDCPSCGTSCW